ncbi:heme peroxidase [Chytridium lagenaria]|nr:heme peroxidase [Chytridium lagenaria]
MSLTTRFVDNLENIVNVSLSDADQIAMGAAITVRHCGGPNVVFRPGRGDVPKSAPNDIKLLAGDPFAPYADVLASFERMGLDKLDMMVLTTGSHTMGGAHRAISPKVTNETFAPFDDTPGVFDNDVFKRVLEGRCVLKLILKGYMERYAADQQAFFDQYLLSFDKMMNLTHLLFGAIAEFPVPGDLAAVRRGMGLPPLTTTTATTRPTSTSTPAGQAKSGAGEKGCRFAKAFAVGAVGAVLGMGV